MKKGRLSFALRSARLAAGASLFLIAVHALAQSKYDPTYFRRAPLLKVDTANEISVRDFGALPDDGKPDTAAIAAAIREAAAKGNCRVVFEKGVYNLNRLDEKQNFALALVALKDSAIDGRGATLIVNEPTTGVFMVRDCDRVIIENFKIDYDPLPHSWGAVVNSGTDADKCFIDLKIAPGMPPLDAPHLKDSLWGFFIDKNVPGRLAYNRQNVFYHDSSTRISDGVFRIWFRAGSVPETVAKSISAGDLYSVTIRPSACIGFIAASKDVTFKDFEIYASAGGAFTGSFADAPNFINCRLLLKDGRRKVSNSDSFHLQNAITGPWIENCVSDAIADDAVNMYVRPNYIASAEGKTLKVSRSDNLKGGFSQLDYRVGDTVAFFDGATSKIIGRATVENADFAKGVLTLNEDAPAGVKAGGNKASDTTLYNISLAKGFVIKNSVFKNSRRYGIYVKASMGLIEGNTFDGLSADCIMIVNEPGWPEGLIAENLVIAHNTFKSCGFEPHYLGIPVSGCITVICGGNIKDRKDYYPYKNIIIDGNKFENWRRSCLALQNIENLKIINNTFGKPRPANGIGAPDVGVLNLRNCKAVEKKGNANASGLADKLEGIVK